MKLLSILGGKLALFMCKLLKRGSSFPGDFAYKLDKKIFLKEVLIYEKNGKLYDLETRELYHKIAEETNKTINVIRGLS